MAELGQPFLRDDSLRKRLHLYTGSWQLLRVKGDNKPLLEACTIKHYAFVIYRFHSSKVMCLTKPVEVSDNSKKH
jgi:hypothetical protein